MLDALPCGQGNVLRANDPGRIKIKGLSMSRRIRHTAYVERAQDLQIEPFIRCG
jgi:hypothetical protein